MIHPNPYVGPRAFREGETLYARTEEALRLFYLLLADRIVVLHSPSGAGKSSLLNAELAPRLRKEKFRVFKDLRVSRIRDEAAAGSANRLVLATILSIEAERENEQPKRVPVDQEQLPTMTLGTYLGIVAADDGDNPHPMALLFDQFEEVFTVDPAGEEARLAFFRELGRVLRANRSIWVVFGMREEFIARLDDYAGCIPSRFESRQRLLPLTREQAIEAIQRPADKLDVKFSAAPRLVDDLSRIRIQRPDGTIDYFPGREVEPLYLQVVCRTLWGKPRRKKREISDDDLGGSINVDTALGDYYAACIAAVVSETSVSQRQLRDWFSLELIDEHGVRKQVMRGVEAAGGLPNKVIELLDSEHHLVRREERGTRVFYELAHDRLVDPVRENNVIWSRNYLQDFQRLAAEWQQNPQRLLRDQELVRALQWAAKNPGDVTKAEQLFLNQSRGALNDFERAAIDWEVASRDPGKLLTGDAVRFALKNAEQKEPYGLSEIERAFLNTSSQIWRLERRRKITERAASAFPVAFVLIGLALGHYSERKAKQDKAAASALAYARGRGEVSQETLALRRSLEELLRESGASSERTIDLKTLTEAVDAERQITRITNPPALPARTTVIHYYQKRRDNPKLREALESLGFAVDIVGPNAANQTNSISYGSAVPEEDAKLVAYAIIRAGNTLQTIRKRDDSTGTPPNVINVGYYPSVADAQPLTAEEIAGKPLGQLARPAAKRIGEAEGQVTSFDANKREGMIDPDEPEAAAEGPKDPVFFRLEAAEAAVAQGDRVTFEAYGGGDRRVYAIKVRKKTPETQPPPTTTTAPPPESRENTTAGSS